VQGLKGWSKHKTCGGGVVRQHSSMWGAHDSSNLGKCVSTKRKGLSTHSKTMAQRQSESTPRSRASRERGWGKSDQKLCSCHSAFMGRGGPDNRRIAPEGSLVAYPRQLLVLKRRKNPEQRLRSEARGILVEGSRGNQAQKEAGELEVK